MKPIEDLPVSFWVSLANIDSAIAVLAQCAQHLIKKTLARITINKVQERTSLANPEGKAHVSIRAPHPQRINQRQWKLIAGSNLVCVADE